MTTTLLLALAPVIEVVFISLLVLGFLALFARLVEDRW